MFVQLVDASSVPTIINTDAISYIQVSMKETQEDPTQLEFKRAIVIFGDPSRPILLDETNYNILKNAMNNGE